MKRKKTAFGRSFFMPILSDQRSACPLMQAKRESKTKGPRYARTFCFGLTEQNYNFLFYIMFSFRFTRRLPGNLSVISTKIAYVFKTAGVCRLRYRKFAFA
jgi:hypothetical protein